MSRTRVRWSRVVVLAVLMASVGGTVAGRAGAAAEGTERPRFYVVRPGDTVWDVARRHVGAEADPRPVVDELLRVNGIVNGRVLPGQRLELPG